MDDMKKLLEGIVQCDGYQTLLSEIQKVIASPAILPESDPLAWKNAIRQAGLETSFRNLVVHYMRNAINSPNKDNAQEAEPLAYMKKTQSQWERRIQKSLNSLAKELRQSLAKIRCAAEAQEIEARWTELSTYDIDLSVYRPVYAPRDFFDLITSLRDPDYVIDSLEEHWSSMQLPLKVNGFPELKAKYEELYKNEDRHLGLNPSLVLADQPTITLLNYRIVLGEQVLDNGDVLLLEEFCKKGCPPNLRAPVWSKLLNAEVTEQVSIPSVYRLTSFLPRRKHYEELKQSIFKADILIDKLVMKDIQLTAANEEHYFVFEDLLYQVTLCFLRDEEVLVRFQQSGSSAPPRPPPKTLPTVLAEQWSAYPPSGVVPCYGFSMYVAPLCFAYGDAITLYYAFRAQYLRYWHRLHSLSSHPHGIVYLAIQFERLLQGYEPQLWVHLIANQIQPLRIAMGWIMQAFSGYLLPDQVLYLWDIIMGFDSLEILPLMAAAIFSLRRDNLLSVKTTAAVEAVLADLSTIKVIPLLQLTLGSELKQ